MGGRQYIELVGSKIATATDLLPISIAFKRGGAASGLGTHKHLAHTTYWCMCKSCITYLLNS